MKTQNKKGFSIVEILVYLAIFTALSILVINSFITILSSFDITNMNRKLLESGTISMERISREIRQAESVNAITTSTALVLNSHDNLESDMVIKFINEDGKLNFYKNDNLEGNLLGQNISVTNLIFSRITTAKSEAVRIIMTLQYSGENNIKSENFYDTIILRGGY